jgi:hypothetical protein
VGIIDLLNDNAGIATTAFVVLTFLTLLETRAARIGSTSTAHVAVRPDIDLPDVTDLKLLLRNHGPAVAQDVRLTLRWLEGSSERGRNKTLFEPILGIGDERRYEPALLLAEPTEAPTLGQIADMGLVLRIHLTWLDERRWWFAPWWRRRASDHYDLVATEFSESVYGGPLVLRKDTMREEVHEIGRQLQAMNDRTTREEMKHWKVGDAEARATLERQIVLFWVRSERELWKHRLRVWFHQK